MNYLVGSAVKIKSEVSEVSGTVVTLSKLLGPDGSSIIADQAMSFDTVNTSVAFMVWQSTENTHTKGRYKYIIKAVNGAYTNIGKGFFNLEDQV